MTKFSYDNKSLFKDSKRYFPVMGEIHYSRYPEQYWKEALLKMKAGGVDVVSSYTIWIHHEEIENEWDFSGCRNLRKFVETIKECGLDMILRIGPWVHAEVRNGGFPDWLLKKCPKARTNDESYFAEVEKFYAKIFEQVKGLLLKDGGPIIGVQIENEFGHCGGLYGEEGEVHMKRLEKMARDTGFDVPLYTATGWGGAVTAGMLPVMGGYCDAPWDPRPAEIEPSGNFLFTYERNDHAIGSDFGLGEGITFDMTKFPYLTAELGGGLQVTYKRRPVAQGKDIGAMSLSKMGSGCNLLGYYMYHGGCNPEGKLTTLEENIASGSINDLSIKNYDFRAPLGEYGQKNSSFDEIKLYSLFVHDFGETLCETDTFIPEENPSKPENSTALRKSFRLNQQKSGYVFVNNYQRHQKMAEHKNVVLAENFDAVDICNEDFYFLPINMKLSSSVLSSALVTPLCHLDEKTFVFYSAAHPAGKDVLLASRIETAKTADKTYYKFSSAEGDETIVTLSREDALCAYKIFDGNKKAHLAISDATIYQGENSGELFVSSTNSAFIKVFPNFDSVPAGLNFVGEENGFFVYKADFAEFSSGEVKVTKLSENEKTLSYELEISNIPQNSSDIFMDISYLGNTARLYQNGSLVDDQIFCGEDYKWQIGLKKFGLKNLKFSLEIDALFADQKDKVYIEKWPSFGTEKKLCVLNSVVLNQEQTLKIKF